MIQATTWSHSLASRIRSSGSARFVSAARQSTPIEYCGCMRSRSAQGRTAPVTTSRVLEGAHPFTWGRYTTTSMSAHAHHGAERPMLIRRRCGARLAGRGACPRARARDERGVTRRSRRRRLVAPSESAGEGVAETAPVCCAVVFITTPLSQAYRTSWDVRDRGSPNLVESRKERSHRQGLKGGQAVPSSWECLCFRVSLLYTR